MAHGSPSRRDRRKFIAQVARRSPLEPEFGELDQAVLLGLGSEGAPATEYQKRPNRFIRSLAPQRFLIRHVRHFSGDPSRRSTTR